MNTLSFHAARSSGHRVQSGRRVAPYAVTIELADDGPPEGYEPAPRAKGKYRKKIGPKRYDYWQPGQPHPGAKKAATPKSPRSKQGKAPVAPEAKAASEPKGMQKLRAMKTKLGFPPAERSVADKVLPQVSAQDLAEVMDMLVRRDPQQAAGSVLGGKIDPKDVAAVDALKKVTGGGSVQDVARELGRAITAMEARAKSEGHSLWGRSTAKHVRHKSSLLNQLEAHWRAKFGGKVAGEAADGLLRVVRML